MTLYKVWPYSTDPARAVTVRAHHPSEAAAKHAREQYDNPDHPPPVTIPRVFSVLEQGAPASAVRTYETTRELVPYYRTREL